MKTACDPKKEHPLPGVLRVSKKLRRIFRVSGKQSKKHFPPGRVPGGKYFSGCKCGICLPLADKLCAQQTAKYWRKRPKVFFDKLGKIPCVSRGFFSDCQKSLAEFAAAPAKKVKSFSAGACTWQKILLRLQVWNLSAIGRQIMHVAACKELAEKAEGLFRQI